MRETIFRVTRQYAAFSLANYLVASGVVLMPLLADAGMQSTSAAAVVFGAEVLGLVWLVRRLSTCGIFLDGSLVELRTVTRTTAIPFSRLRIYGDKVSFVAQAAMVPVFTDLEGRTVKAGVLSGADHSTTIAVVRTIRHSRDTATSGVAATEVG